jgi:hypothetical protein
MIASRPGATKTHEVVAKTWGAVETVSAPGEVATEDERTAFNYFIGFVIRPGATKTHSVVARTWGVEDTVSAPGAVAIEEERTALDNFTFHFICTFT